MEISTDDSDACTAFNVMDNNFGNMVNTPSSGASTLNANPPQRDAQAFNRSGL